LLKHRNGCIVLVSILGDRRDYYRLAGDVWEHQLTRGITLTTALRHPVEKGLAVRRVIWHAPR
jgi:hypothetical protein